MSIMKRLATPGNGNIYTIGDKNPYIGCQVSCTWKKPWGKKPVGFNVKGELLRTFVVNGRTLIGEVKTSFEVNGNQYGKKVACPWSRNYLDVQVL